MGIWITLSEIRLALRLIAKQPILSITVVIALATGIGLATVGFTLREAFLNGQLPFPNGDRFVRLVLHSEAENNVQLDLDAYHAIRDTSSSFAHIGAVGDAVQQGTNRSNVSACNRTAGFANYLSACYFHAITEVATRFPWP